MVQLEQLAKLGQLGQLAELDQLVELLRPADIAGCTELLIIQGTPFCNLDCGYCYLPDRDNRRRMSMDTAEAALRWTIESGLAAKELTVVWHAGEPLVLPPSWYETMFDRLADNCPPSVKLSHSFQTNGILIDETWRDVFGRRDVRLGLSIDGPAHMHDANRRTRRGGATHAVVLKSVEKLHKWRVPFHVIAVVTAKTLKDPDGFLDFFDDLGATEVGLNFEETEGANTQSSMSGIATSAIEDFIEAVVTRVADTGRPRIREVHRLLARLRSSAFDQSIRNHENAPFRIVTIDVDGGIHTFSPELALSPQGGFDGQALGNVHRDTISDILASDRFCNVWLDIKAGIESCEADCAYFRVCGGGGPSNKLAEHGRFDATETLHCRVAVQSLTEIVLTRLEHDLRLKPGRAR